ncbi:surfactin non-ribosomal peptide synthetase SrfAB, partial [Bacillus velezensis]
VQLEHRNLINYVTWFSREAGLTEADKSVLLSSYAFDLGYTAIFPILQAGGELHIVPKETYTAPDQLGEYIQKNGITYMKLTPSLFHMIVNTARFTSERRFSPLRLVVLGGEKIITSDVRKFHDVYAHTDFINHYGPTETTIGAIAGRINMERLDQYEQRPVIGRPIANTGALVLDGAMQLVPPGASGELYITGKGLARGYLHRPQLTAEKFLSNPFSPDSLMYKTGDVVRRLSDGTIEFIGRADDQVKIRGYRIELKEVETVLLSVNGIQEAVVLAVSEGGLPELCAFYKADSELKGSELRKRLSETLPSHMLPAYFVQVERIPLTANGKTDKNALPKPGVSQTAQTASALPETELEEKLCRIWKQTLGTDTLGIDDNFFDYGGHSLKGMMLLANIQAELDKTVPLKALFEQPTVRLLAAYIEKSAVSEGYRMITPAASADAYPLSSAQKRMYVLNQLDRETISYNMPSVLLMEGEVNISRLQEALNQMINRHESLRTSFIDQNGRPMQQIAEQADIDLHIFEAADEEKADLIIQAFIKPFDLSAAPLIRAALVRLNEKKHLLLLDMHHIIADGVSRSMLVKELAHLYKGGSLPSPNLHYKDFAVWQNEPEQAERMKDHERYWLSAFSGELPELNLPTDFPRPPVQSFKGQSVRFRAGRETEKAVRELMESSGATLHMVLHAAFHVFLSKITGQRDIIIGSVTAGRTSAEVQEMPGMFVNTLALRNETRKEQTFAGLLEQVKQTNLDALAHQDYPFEDLIGKLDLPRDMSRNPLFQVMVTTEDPDKETLELENLRITPYESNQGTAKFDLTLGGFTDQEGLGLQFEYAADLFKKETIEKWSAGFLRILKQAAENPDRKLPEISLISDAEKQALLDAWKGKTISVPRDKTVHRLFEETAARHANRPAVAYNGAKWTYGELNARANRIARILMDCGVTADERVGILTKPSLEMAAGVLGVLKAGAAFVPIDPDYPKERISYILQDSGAKLLLTQEALDVPESYTGDTILLDGSRSILSLPLDENDEANPQTETTADHLAYMIYTSGTTGQPKGVMVEHHALVNLCFWHHDAFAMTAEDKSAKYAGFGFDASIWEMFPTWTIGAELHVIDEAIRLDITRLNHYFEEHGVTITFLPTQLAEQFMELENSSLRMLLVGGDKLKRAVKQPYTIVNNYGPTENTVVATSGVINPEEGSLSIGRAIANTRAYILGDGDQVQPEGIAGELCVAGRGLARGYLNREEETAKRFTADPFVPGERMYRTGDLVKWNAQCGIEYIGRIDQQVKVRGYRIELSEIEVRLAQLADVHDAAVTAVEDKAGNTALCAYVAPQQDDIETLKAALKDTLPDYMVPAFWVEMDELPVTANGKIDKKALPEPDIEAGSAAYKAPETEMETLLSDIWQEVLGLDQIGVSDNFFTLGGDSIKGIQMASRLNQHGYKLEMKDLFQHPTIEELVSYVERTEGKQADQGPVEGEAELTPIQRWFFEKNFTDKHHWNQSVMLHAKDGFDPEITEKTLHVLTVHHDALRMIYREQKPYYRGLEDVSVELNVFELNGPAEDHEDRIEREADRLQSSISLETGHLLKAGLFRAEDGDHLLLAIHHLVVDGVSWRILLEDFTSVYTQLKQGNEPALPPKTHSFAEFAERIKEYANTKAFLKEADYWRELEEKEVCTQLPKDRQSGDQRMKHTRTVSFSLTPEQTEQLTTNVHEAYHTEMNDILLTALGLALKEWTGEDTIGVHLEGHGREDILDGLNITRTVGWFTSMYPMILEMKHADDLSYQLKQMKEDIRHIPNKGVGYGILRYVTAPEHKENLSFEIDPDISFNYLGQFNEMSDSGLFTRSGMPSGQSLSPDTEKPNALDIVGFIENGQMTMTFAYHSLEFHEKTIQSFSDSFKGHLLKIIDHCLAQDGPELTPSDLGDDDLTLDELDKLMEIL